VLGERGGELGIPVYSRACDTGGPPQPVFDPRGRIRGLWKLRDPHWRPDFGEPKLTAPGATVIGARKF
jgi:glutamate formiminotransferase